MTFGNYTHQSCLHPGAKQETRELPLDIIKQSSFLFDEETETLRCGWAELCGYKAPTFEMLISKKILQNDHTSGFFVGIDIEKKIIEDCKKTYTSGHWICTKMKEFLLSKKYQQISEKIGVLVFDSHDGMNRNSFKNSEIKDCIQFAKKQYQALGEFLLIINIVGNKRFITDNDKQNYTDFLSKEIGFTISPHLLKKYKSKKTDMYWLAIRFGF